MAHTMREIPHTVWLGVWLVVVPFLGVPAAWKEWLIILTGIGVLAAQFARFRCGNREAAPSEGTAASSRGRGESGSTGSNAAV